MAEDINSKLTGDDIRRFERTLASFDATLARQEEIVNKVLEVEQNIGTMRLGWLDKYFDAYSKGLDDIIARKTSTLQDTFLIAEHEATKKAKENAQKNNTQTTSYMPSGTAPNNNAGNDGENKTQPVDRGKRKVYQTTRFCCFK